MGLTGSLGHCLGMCGPLILIVQRRFSTQGLAGFMDHLLYHAGRISVYVLLGIVAGIAGDLTGGALRLAHASGLISIVFGLLIFLAGWLYGGWLQLPGMSQLGVWWQKALTKTRRFSGQPGIFLFGVLNGFLPCGLVASALFMAVTTADVVKGAAGMLVFGLGTLPALLALGLGAGKLSVFWRRTIVRVAAIFVMLVGVQLTLRGLAGLGLIQHLMLPGKVMVW